MWYVPWTLSNIVVPNIQPHHSNISEYVSMFVCIDKTLLSSILSIHFSISIAF